MANRSVRSRRNHHPETASPYYALLFDNSSDGIEYGIALAEAQIAAHKAADALRTIRQLRSLPTEQSGDPRIDLAEARANRQLQNAVAEYDFAMTAEAKTNGPLPHGVLAEAQYWRADALLTPGLGKPDDAIADAKAYFKALGDRGGIARADELSAIQRDNALEYKQERAVLQRIMGIYKELGSQRDESRVAVNIGQT